MQTVAKHVVIIGGGIAGLSCARHLVSHGLAVQILEASSGIGGRIKTDEQDNPAIPPPIIITCFATVCMPLVPD